MIPSPNEKMCKCYFGINAWLGVLKLVRDLKGGIERSIPSLEIIT